jgi:hypothetical protein
MDDCVVVIGVDQRFLLPDQARLEALETDLLLNTVST